MLSKTLLALALAAVPVTPMPAPHINGFTITQQYNFKGQPGTTVPTSGWNIRPKPNSPLLTSRRGASRRERGARPSCRRGSGSATTRSRARRGSGRPSGSSATRSGTVHCDVSPGGICNEGDGIGGTVGISDQGWHVWRVVINRRPDAWTNQSITWFRNGVRFMRVTGGRIGNQAVWESLTAKPLYVIVNVAVGGTFPGNPNADTKGGPGSEMEVAYIAHYTSN